MCLVAKMQDKTTVYWPVISYLKMWQNSNILGKEKLTNQKTFTKKLRED
jgi:hypothetical protein